MVENNFLRQLLLLQQDGKGAISAPANWGNQPLLQIKTYLDQTIEYLVQNILDGRTDRTNARWHFFVGSPGNGKSAGTGELVQRLVKAGYKICDSAGTPFADLASGVIPYELEVFEPGSAFPCALVAQDASVVPDPFDPAADPAGALCALLQRAAERGVSAIVCTNRGVLEKAFATHYLDKKSNEALWFRAISASTLGRDGFSQSFAGRQRKTFAKVEFSYTNLDRRSLLLNSQSFEQLIEKATEEASWKVCNECSARALCPFFQNRVWLQDEDLKNSLISVVREAEILSGQVIVFREALALISLILSGCPHDYKDGAPCRWVHQEIEAGRYFDLLSRRIYMILFSAYTAYGLEEHPEDARAQKEGISYLGQLVPERAATLCSEALGPVLASKASLSSDVGVERLLGKQGIFRSIDPFSDISAQRSHDRWDNEAKPPLAFLGEHATALEHKCAEVWTALRDAAETRGDHCHAPFWKLQRWITSFTYRAGALFDREVAFCEEIDQLFKILSVSETAEEGDLRLTLKVQEELRRMLHADGAGTAISPFGRLKGEWADSNLKAEIDIKANANGQSVALPLKIGPNTSVPLSALAFAWLKRRIDRRMSDACYPIEYLQTAEDALVKAASESQYSLVPSGVELIVSLPEGEHPSSLSMKRINGRVILDAF